MSPSTRRDPIGRRSAERTIVSSDSGADKPDAKAARKAAEKQAKRERKAASAERR